MMNSRPTSDQFSVLFFVHKLAYRAGPGCSEKFFASREFKIRNRGVTLFAMVGCQVGLSDEHPRWFQKIRSQ
jgi:hypothetical protein